MKTEFVRAITLLARAFRQEVDDLLLEAYWIGLEGLAPEEVQEACVRAIRGSKFMPSPVELREYIGRAPTSALHRPALRCRACNVGLSFADSQGRGYCGPCWRKVEEREKAKRLPARKELAG